MANLSSININGYSILFYNYLFKVNNRKTRTRCEIQLKLTIKTPCSSMSVVEQVIIDGVVSFKQIVLYLW